MEPHFLCNSDIKNYHSSLAHLSAVQDYLDKETTLGAMLGPVSSIDNKHYHCSPLLTRPTDIDNRRIILNLSHPYGFSVNDQVNKFKFDGRCFTLNFPSVDDIVQDIIDTDDHVIFKIDVVPAF